MKGLVSLVSWPTADSLPINGYPLAAGQVQVMESSLSETDVLPLSYTANQVR